MKNLEQFGVQEMDSLELSVIDGGSWLSRAWDNTVNALDSAYHWCKDTLGLDVQIGRV